MGLGWDGMVGGEGRGRLGRIGLGRVERGRREKEEEDFFSSFCRSYRTRSFFLVLAVVVLIARPFHVISLIEPNRKLWARGRSPALCSKKHLSALFELSETISAFLGGRW